MADPNVKLRFSGDASDAERAISKLERKYDALEGRIRNSGRTGKAAAGDMAAGMRGVGTEVASMALRFASVPALILQAVSAQKQFTEEAAATSAALGEQEQRLRVQAGFSATQGAAAQKKVLAAAYATGTTSDVANKAAVQLISSGFDTGTSTGAGLTSVLKTLVATNKFGEDPTELVQAVGQFLSAQGLEKNAENLDRVLVAGQSLFQQTDFQISDLTQLAGKSGSLRGQDLNQILGVFDVLRSVQVADKASTGLKIFTDRLKGAEGDDQREKQLKKLGLETGDVDLVGEDLVTVIGRVGDALDAQPEEQRAGILQRLFGTEAASPIEALLANRGQIEGAVATSQDRTGFEAAALAGSTGTAAALRRQKVESEFLNLTVETEKTASLAAAATEETDLRLRAEGASSLYRSLPNFRTFGDLLPRAFNLGTGAEVNGQSQDVDASNFKKRAEGGGIISRELVEAVEGVRKEVEKTREDAYLKRGAGRAPVPEGAPVPVVVPRGGRFE